eukprot:tig00000190_g13852.t1
MTMKTTKRPSAAMAMKTMPPVDLNHVHAVSAEMNGFESDFEESAAGPAAGPELEDPVPELELELPVPELGLQDPAESVLGRSDGKKKMFDFTFGSEQSVTSSSSMLKQWNFELEERDLQ